MPWDGTQSAQDFSSSCWQELSEPGAFYDEGEIERSEDCLYLNVWSAAEGADEARPVMVWIHGGGLQNGSGSTVLYDGENFANRGVVLVTINYRLGPMGFLAHPDLSAENNPPSSGNYGILDQIQALQWVNENIHHFGGDPGRVTIFGESAGSWSVNYLTASPLAAGLFQRAIGHSGGIFWPMQQLQAANSSGLPPAESAGTVLAARTGAGSAKELRALSVEEVYVASDVGVLLQPNTDGWVFPRDVYDIFAAGQQNDVDTIVGFNEDEGTALFAAAVPNTVSDYKKWLAATYPGHGEAFSEVYPAASDEEAKVAGFSNMADHYFGWQMRTWARLQTKTGTKPARLYFFSRTPPWNEGETYGAYHAAEILYAFNNFDKSSALRTEIGPFNHEWNDVDRQIADVMSSYWINFATTGDPNGAGLPEWIAFTSEGDNAMHFGDEIGPTNGVFKEKLDAFDAFYSGQRVDS